MEPRVLFDDVSKKFRTGERHDSLRDLLPAAAAALWRKKPQASSRDFWALRNVSFEVRAGEALGIIGPNGAGKSTTLKILTHILKPTTGRREVKGRIGALIEVAAGFHPDLSGRENVFLQGAIMGMPRNEIRRRFDEIVDFAGVSSFIDTPVKRYSSGMNARLGFSIAAHLSPDALIIDEVLSVGDMTFQQRCYERMRQFKREGMAIVLVSHNLQAVGTLCDQAIYLARTVHAQGPTADVLTAYVRSTQTVAPEQNASEPVQIESVSFAGQGAEHTHRDIVPGEPLTLRVRFRSRDALDDVTFGFLINRSTDQLLVYDGNVHRRELGPVDRFSGEVEVEFRFRPHLVRGHYYVSLHVFHNATQSFFVPHRPVATLTVSETRSWAGVADIELEAALPGAPEDAVQASLGRAD